jgi:hypothetical protein
MTNKEFLNIQLASISDESPYSDRKKALFFIHDFKTNNNGLVIPQELCESINLKSGKPYFDSLNNCPIVCATTYDMTDLKGHEPQYSLSGELIRLDTQSLGTLYDAHIGTHVINGEEIYGLWAWGAIWTRFQSVLNVVEQLFEEQGSISTSVEVLIGGFEYLEDVRVATTSILYIGHCLLGTTKKPAYDDSALYELNFEAAEIINQAFQNDIAASKDKGGKSVEIEFNNGKEIKFHFEANAMSFEDIQSAIWNNLNPSLNGETKYNYWISEVFDSYVIVCEWDSNKYYKMTYTINESENTATVDVASAIEVVQVWQEVGTPEVASLQDEITQLNNKITELNTQIEQLQGEVKTKDEALNLSSSEAAEKIIALGSLVEDLKVQLASLLPIKEDYDKKLAEIATQEENAKRETLKQYALNSKVIAEKDFEDVEELKIALASLDEVKIKSYIADKYVEKAKLELNSTETPVVVNVTPPEDLVVGNVASKYGF